MTMANVQGTQNRITAMVSLIEERLAALSPEKVESLRSAMSLDFKEHYAYQDAQAIAHASGKLTLEEAQMVYIALGPTYSGGWPKATSLAMRVVVTKLIAELMGMK